MTAIAYCSNHVLRGCSIMSYNVMKIDNSCSTMSKITTEITEMEHVRLCRLVKLTSTIMMTSVVERLLLVLKI